MRNSSVIRRVAVGGLAVATCLVPMVGCSSQGQDKPADDTTNIDVGRPLLTEFDAPDVVETTNGEIGDKRFVEEKGDRMVITYGEGTKSISATKASGAGTLLNLVMPLSDGEVPETRPIVIGDTECTCLMASDGEHITSASWSDEEGGVSYNVTCGDEIQLSEENLAALVDSLE